MNPVAQYLVGELERLMLLPLTTKEDLERWYSECADVEEILETKYPDFDFEHEVRHFFIDADIRLRDAGYRNYQHQLMSNYARRLRNENTDS